VISVVTLLLNASIGNTQGIVTEGRLDCGLWVKARSDRRAETLEHYFLGLMNGLAVGTRVEFWRADGQKISREQVYLWMDNYCRQTPLSSVIEGAIKLMNERTKSTYGLTPSP
jgi:hypothetical protein